MSGLTTTTYLALVARSRVERRSEWVLKILGRHAPGRLKERPLLLFGAWKFGVFVVETALSVGALSGLLRLTDALTALSLMFAALLTAGAAIGLSTQRRTVAPPDHERLAMAPISDRRSYSLAFLGYGLLDLADNALLLPLVAGIAASVVFGAELFQPALWAALALTMLCGISLAIVADRSIGGLRVRRVRRGARSASLVGYAFFSTVAFGFGALLAKVLVPWLSDAPWKNMLVPEELFFPDTSAGWLFSFPKYASDALSLLQPAFTHPVSPSGALARASEGNLGSMLIAALWSATLAVTSALLWSGGGGWYRSEWQAGWQNWNKGDLFDLAEKFYLKVAGMLRPGDGLLRVQIHNLCRRREWVVARATDFIGGAVCWVYVGLAFGSAPFFEDSYGAAAVFALLVGGRTALEISGAPFVNFQESLALDAEGRQAGMYRAAGVSLFGLFRAKLWLGRLIGALPLAATLLLVAVLARLPLGSWILLALAALASWVVASYVNVLPGLVSPHFEWDHPSELGDYYEQTKISSVAGRASAVVTVVQFALVLALLKAWIPQNVFTWVAAGAMVLVALAAEVVLQRLSRQAATLADRADFLA